MIDSDSDLEVLDVVVPERHFGSKCLPCILESDNSDDELLDLDDDIDDIMESEKLASYRVGSKSNAVKTKKTRKRTVSSPSSSETLQQQNSRKSVPEEVVLLDEGNDEEDNESIATEVVRDDDLDSLPSISPPSPTYQVTTYDNDMETNYNNVADPVYHSSCSGTATTIGKSSSKSSLRDNDIDFDDLVQQEAEYESLADYLAKIDKKKKKAEKSPGINKSNPSSTGAGPSISKSIPSFVSFASQSLSAKYSVKSADHISKAKEGSLKSDEKTIGSYQVNRKSPSRKGNKKGKTTKKDKENISVPVPCSSTSSSSATVQGPVRQKQPKDILKMIVLQIDEDKLSDELAAKLIEKEIQFKIVTSPAIPDSIMFEHNVPYKMVEKDLQVQEKVLKEIDANILIIFHVEEKLELLKSELDRADPTASERSKCLTEWVQDIQRKNPERKITLLIYGLEAYLRKIQRAVQKEYRERVLQGDKPDNSKKKRKGNTKQEIKLSRYEVQNALISAQLETHINYRFYDNTSDLALLLFQYTKSVGEAPQKQEKMKSTDFDWYAVADAVGGIPVEENGQGMRSLWLAQLQQFPKVGQESALAIARIYASPKALYQAYRRCSSVEEGKNLLTNVQVTMGVGPLAKTRRLGPEASKKIYRFFTSTDGEREIDG